MNDRDYYDTVKQLIVMQKQAMAKLATKNRSLGLKALEKAIQKLDKETTIRLERL